MPNSVRLAAARAYVEYVADLLDSGNTDRQVEGAIAKVFATEAGNLAADDAVQALGGYGYCVEYEVEKIRRDVRILRIYEGTSEILQNIVGLYAIAEVETTVALVRAAGISDDALLKAQARVWASEVALSVPTRLLKLFSAAGVLDEAAFAEFEAAADLSGAMGMQAGRLADMDLIAKGITSD